MQRSKKKPKISREPPTGISKTPVIGNPPPQFRGGIMAWRLNAVDRNGPFSWSVLEESGLYLDVIKHLASMETMEESELEQQGSHSIELGNLSEKAQERLANIKLDDVDSLYSIRFSGQKRVFCVHRHNYMRLLWWDPAHDVCKSKKKHT